jgi:ribosomal protein S18 acetylase RimI-like enzyme
MHPLDAHFAAAIGVFAEHSPTGRRAAYDGVLLTATGIGGAAFNAAWVTGPAPSDALDAACDVLAGADAPYLVMVPEPYAAHCDPSLRGRGLTVAGTAPAMVRPATADLPPVPDGLRVERVRDERALDDLALTVAAAFGRAGARSPVYVPSLLADERVALFTGYDADGPVATAGLVTGAGQAGIYAVGVREEARGRGYGAALTRAAVAHAATTGYADVVLQATELGEPLYRRMGFATVRGYQVYRAA